MCRALDEMCENAIKETKEKYDAELKEKDAVIDAVIAEKDAAIAEKDAVIAEKDAAIDQLKRQLEALTAAQRQQDCEPG